jgi:azurin/glucose/arabinose dehydrogenase
MNLPKRFVFVCSAIMLLLVASTAQAGDLKIKENDRIVILGNTFAERMHLFGYFETFLHSRFPDHRLRVRYLAWPAEEVGKPIRPKGFPRLVDELRGNRADVVFVCYGMNESFRGSEEVGHFRHMMESFVRQLRAEKFNGNSPPQVVLVTPIAQEISSATADVPARNSDLKDYSEGVLQVAKKLGVHAVDLFSATAQRVTKQAGRLTFNGIHLTESGYQVASRIMAKQLGLLDASTASQAKGDPSAVDAFRRLVYEKNYWHQLWWHAPNASYIHGRRNQTPGSKHLGRERKQSRQLVEDMDRQIWETQKPRVADIWRKIPVDGKPIWFPTPASRSISGDVPESLWAVEEDGKPGRAKSPETELAMMKVASGYQVNLFASEVDFPIANPMAIQFDSSGRLWVGNTPTWPHPLPGKQPDDSIVILEDQDGDGVADRHTVFLDHLNLLHGFGFGEGGVLLAQAPNLVLARDTDNDGQSDWVRVLLHGFGAEDAEHAMNNFRWSPGGSLYFTQGIFYNTQVETPYGPSRVRDAAVFRYRPGRHQFSVYVSHSFWNPFGNLFDRWGGSIMLDASAGQYYPMDVFSSNFVYPKNKRRTDHLAFNKGGHIAAGCELLYSRHFPEEAQGRFLVNHCVGEAGTAWYSLKPKESVYQIESHGHLLQCDDPLFRPVAMALGPDGALYIADFYTQIFENVNFSKRHPGRDHRRGRIWRITHPDRPLLKQPRTKGEPVEALLGLLKSHESSTREFARRELQQRPSKDVIPALDEWLNNLNPAHLEREHYRTEALWVRQGLNEVDSDLLQQQLKSANRSARAAAAKVLRYWQEQIDSADELIRQMVNDPDPRVRLYAIIACSYSSSPKALAIAMEAAAYPMDPGLEHALAQTLGFLSGRPEPTTVPGPSFGQLALRLQRGENAKEAITALHRMPAETWPTEQVNSLAQNLLSYLKNLPIDQRVGQAGLELLSLCQMAAGRLPEELAQSLRTELREYGTPFHIIRTLPARMQYDRGEIHVMAGEPIRLLFENNDTMPHNLVLVALGAREEVGRAAEEMATQPGAWEKGYIPDSDKILQATRLLKPGESELLTFNVPSKPGKYEFVCTFPGHWRTMYGVLSVSPR